MVAHTVILTTWRVGDNRILVTGQLGQNHENLPENKLKAKRTEDVVQMIERLSSNGKALSSSPSTTKKKKRCVEGWWQGFLPSLIGQWGRQIDSRDGKVSTQVGFIREKRKTTARACSRAREPVAHCCLHRGVFIWSFLLGRGGAGVRSGVVS
jgi:hypothetical protein